MKIQGTQQHQEQRQPQRAIPSRKSNGDFKQILQQKIKEASGCRNQT